MVDLNRQIRATQASQGGFSAHLLGKPVQYEADYIEFLPKQSESGQWLFDFVGLGSPEQLAGIVSVVGSFTASLGNDGSPYLEVARTTGTSWDLNATDSRVGTLVNSADGEFKLSLEVWKPAGGQPEWTQIAIRSPTNNSYAGIRTLGPGSNNAPELNWRNTDGETSSSDYASIGGWVSTPYVDGWNKIVIDNTKANVSYTVNGVLPPNLGPAKFNIKGADRIRILRSSSASLQRIRRVRLSAF